MLKFFTNPIDGFWDGVSNLSHSAVNPNVVLTIAIGFMLYYFGRSILRFWKKINPVANDLAKANEVLDCQEENHEQYFYEKYEEISAQLEKIPTMSHHWLEFKEHLILPTDDEATKLKAEELKIKNSLPPSYFFSEEKFIERPIDLRYVDAVPGKLVAMGVLFTFVGLSIGIASATHTLGGLEGALDTPELNKTLMLLLKGASLAFISSVAGILLSLVFSWVEKRKIKNVKKSLNSFVDNLEKCLSLITSEQIHLEIRDATNEQNKKLDGFSNELAISLGNAISKPLDENFNKMADNIAELKNIQQDFSDKLMNTLVDKMSGNISSQAQQNQQQAAETFAGVQQALAQQAEAMSNSQKEMLSSSQQLLKDINNNNKSNQEQMQHQLNNMLDKLGSETINTAAEMQKNIASSSRQMGQELQDAFGNVIANMNKQQQEINNSIQNITDNITDGADKMNAAIASFEKLLATSNDNIKDNHNIQAAYKEIVKHQQDIVAKFSAISQAMDNTNTHMSEASQQNKAAASAFQDSADRVNSLVQGMSTMWQEYDQKFKDTDETMSKNFNHFEKYTNQFQQTIEQHVNALTKEFEKAISLLGEQVEEFADAMGDKKQ